MKNHVIKKPTRKCIVCGCRFELRSNTQWVCSIGCAKIKGNEALEKKKNKLLAIEWTKEKAKIKINTHSKEHKKALQDSINKLARMIDAHFGYTNCIDCDKPLAGHQIDACHLISAGSNNTLRYNLHNLHSGHNHCNVYNPKHESNYKIGIEKRYGSLYLNVIAGIAIEYKEIHLSSQDICDKLKITRKLIRDFNTTHWIEIIGNIYENPELL